MKFGITVKLALLVIAVAVAVTGVTAGVAGWVGAAAITAHKRLDLADEATVRRYVLQDTFRKVGFALRFLAEGRDLKEDLPDALEAFAAGKPFARGGAVAAALRQRFEDVAGDRPVRRDDDLQANARPRAHDLARENGGAVVVEAAVLTFEPAGDGPARPAVGRPFLVLRRGPGGVAQEPGEGGWLFPRVPGISGPVSPADTQVTYPVWRDGDDRLCYSVGYLIKVGNDARGMILVTFDLGRLVHRVAHDQSRVLVLLTDNDGHVLLSPDGRDRLHLGQAEAPRLATLPGFEGLAEYFPGTPESDDRLRRFDGRTLDGTVALPGMEFDAVRQWARGRSAGFFTDDRCKDLSEKLKGWVADGVIYRFSPPNPVERSVGLACPPGTGAAVLDRLYRLERELAPGEPLPDADAPVTCRTFAVHATKVTTAFTKGDQFGLVTAASEEEMRNSIYSSLGRLALYVPVLGLASGLVAWGLSRQFTRPLKTITAAAGRMAEGDFDAPLPRDRRDEIGVLARAFGRMRDHIETRRRELRDTLARMQAVLDTAAEGIISFDQQGRIEAFNQAAERMFGFAAADMIGRQIQPLVELPEKPRPPESPAAGRSSVIRYMAVEAMLHLQDKPLYGVRADGSKFWLEVAFSEVPLEGGRRLITGIFRDITSRKAAEEKIYRMNAELDQKVKLRTAELEEKQAKLEGALHAAQTAVKAKESFVARVSHELRNPLAIILGYNESLQEEAADRGLDDLLPDLQKIHASGSHLLGLVNDILDHAKIEAGELKLDLRDTPLAPVVKDLVTLAQPLAAPNGNQLVVDVPGELGTMKTDAKRLKQVLLNLLSNACKFTEKGTVTLRVTREPADGGDWLRFAVTDSGRGMTAAEMQGLFKPFYQVDGTHTRKAGGTGLGLSITRSLAEQMGGGVGVTSELGTGSTFTVRLPAGGPAGNGAKPAPAADMPAPRPQSRPGAMTFRPKDLSAELPALKANTVLVIDDDAMVRELMERFLTKEGYRVVTAGSGEDGLRLAKQVRPAVITLDVMMPGIDGWAMLAALKTDAHTHDIPVVMLTILDDRGRGFALGAADYVTKPIDWNRLGDILRKHAAVPGAPVLVVDDDANHRELIARWLGKEGWPVVEAANGVEGLKRVEEQRPGLVLLDLMMPEMDGFGFVEELRRRDELAGIPVVIITAKDLSAEDCERLNGCVGQIISKQALARDELLTHVRTCVQRYAAAPAAAAKE